MIRRISINKESMELNTSECCAVNSENVSQIKDPRILATSYLMYKIGKLTLFNIDTKLMKIHSSTFKLQVTRFYL